MTRYRSLGLFLLIAVLFGGAFPAIKAGLEFAPPLLLAAIRYAVSAAVLLGYAAATSDNWRPDAQNDRFAVLAGGTFIIGGSGLLFVGQQFTTSGVAAILYGLIPILTPVAAWFLLPDERLSRTGLLGVTVGFVGVVIVIQPAPADLGGSTLLGQVLVVLAACSVTLGTVLVRRSHPTMSIVGLTGWAMVVGAAIQYGFSLAMGESVGTIHVTPAAVGILLYLAVFASGIGFVVYFTLLKEFGPLEINAVTYLVPVVAVALGWLLLGESIGASALLGFAVIVGGFALLEEREIAAELAHLRGAGR